jgi:RimJ/RimL family protein N-acetyltransferase
MVAEPRIDNKKNETTYTPVIYDIPQLFRKNWSNDTWLRELQCVCQNINSLNPNMRLQWLTSIRQWLTTTPDLTIKHTDVIIECSSLLCDWTLILDVFHHYPECILLSKSKHNTLNTIAYAYWKAGDKHRAYLLLEQYMLIYPEENAIYSLYCHLIDMTNNQKFDGYYREYISNSLFLESLSSHHIDEFFWQYWDPSIAYLCCLPTFNTTEEWNNWLAQQYALNDQHTFAVNHQQHGFIGVVSLVIHNDVGFFYYWLGKDFQHRGLGGEAVNLLLELGQEFFGISCCYAKVFQHNLASQKAMKKLGFTQLPFNAKPPYQNEQLYYLGHDKTDKEKCLELRQLFLNMNSSTGVDMPIEWLVC